jgi:hypothetical protein
MGFVDQFESYPLGRSNAMLDNWPLSDPAMWRDIVPGKTGGQAMALEGQSYPVIRGLGSPTTGRTPYVRIGFSLYLDSPGSSFLFWGAEDETPTGTILFDLIVAAQQRLGSFAYVVNEFGQIMAYNHTTHDYDIVAEPETFTQITGAVQDGLTWRTAACRLGVNSDGYLRLVSGEHDRVLGNQPALVVARSTRRIPFRSWTRVELELFMGTPFRSGYAYCWIDSELAIEAPSVSFMLEATIGVASGPFSVFAIPAPNSHNGNRPVNSDIGGFHSISIPGNFGINEGRSAMDDLFILTDEPPSAGSPLGEIEVVPLALTGDGSVSESEIVGDAPAATRWESVADDDGDDTKVAFEPDEEDRYTFDAVDSGRTVLGVGLSARVKKSDDGTARVQLGVTDDVDDSPLVTRDVSAVDDFETISTVIDQALGGGPLTPTDVNSMAVKLKRRF